MINDTIPLALRVQIEQIAARAALLRAEQSERNAICQESKARMRTENAKKHGIHRKPLDS